MRGRLKKLTGGVELLLFHPAVATRNCDHCRRFLYYEEGEQRGRPVVRGGRPVKRHAKLPPPCRTQVGCPKGTPENPRSLNPRNRRAYEHYLECRATGRFPDDALVRQNAGVIRHLEDLRRRQDLLEFEQLLTTILTAKG